MANSELGKTKQFYNGPHKWRCVGIIPEEVQDKFVVKRQRRFNT